MEWARRRQWTVIAIIAAVVIAALCILAFAIFYKTPTCFDQRQDGDETGTDCGGSCSTVCSAQAQPASVRFARALAQSGRQDLIASIDNPNRDAYAKDARVTIDIYLQDGSTVEKHALMTLPANSSTPLFVPGIADGAIQQVFVSFDQGSLVWTKGTGWDAPPPVSSNIAVGGDATAPRVTATVTNQTAYVENNVPLVVAVYAADGSVVAASQTVVPMLPAQGSAQAVFTWNEPFSAPYARIEVTPVPALPTPAP